jgi:hypothetical protein
MSIAHRFGLATRWLGLFGHGQSPFWVNGWRRSLLVALKNQSVFAACSESFNQLPALLALRIQKFDQSAFAR